MRVLVTGGGGFLGSALIARLAGVHQVASLAHGRHYARLRANLGGGIRWVKGDAHDRATVAEAMADVDVLVHLAGIAGERRCSADPLRSMLSNVDATRVLLDEAARASARSGKERWADGRWPASRDDRSKSSAPVSSQSTWCT